MPTHELTSDAPAEMFVTTDFSHAVIAHCLTGTVSPAENAREVVFTFSGLYADLDRRIDAGLVPPLDPRAVVASLGVIRAIIARFRKARATRGNR